jgi:glycosyltransferase involved in cell wall biosynthesis
LKILYFYQYFSTPQGSWGTRVYEFASEWVKKGHEVTVVTSIYSKSDLKADKFIERQNIDGIDVLIVNVLIDNKQPFLKRILTFLLYSVWSSWYALRLPADVVIASSGPISVGIPGLVAKYLRGRKLVFEARDLWPEGAIELGLLKNRIFQKLAYWFEKRCYKASSLIVALSPGIKSNIEMRYRHNKVISVTNAANIELFSTPLAFPGTPGIKSKSYAIYTGNIGEVNNAAWMLEAARILKVKSENNIKILIIGDGQQKSWIISEIDRLKLDNLLVWDLMPKSELVALIQHALVSLVPLKGTPVLDTSSPNKFFESLAAGVPVIQNTNGWMRDFLEKYQVGFTISPDNAEALADCLLNLSGQREILASMGARGEVLARELFDKRVLADKMLSGLCEICQNDS